MSTGKIFGLFLLLIVMVLGLTWVFQGNDFFLFQYFAPRTEQVRREVFEQSKAYNQGMVQELQNMQFEYVKASPEHKKALGSLILHRAADYPLEKMPTDLRDFIKGLKQEATSVPSRN
jgi:hypothetical protein